MSVKLVFLVLALVAVGAFATPAKKSNYIEQENSCRQVCGLCDCDGFYCEDECICECNLKDDDNLRCIADMKKECDANGLEYEILMQESAKERFLRQAKKSNPLENMAKHLVILKTKRDDAAAAAETVSASEPQVGAPAPEASSEPTVAAENPESDAIVGAPVSALKVSTAGAKALAGLGGLTVPKLLMMVQDGLGGGSRKTPAAAPAAPTPFTLPRLGSVVTTQAPAPAFVLPTFPTTAAPRSAPTFPTFPPMRPLVVQPNFLQ